MKSYLMNPDRTLKLVERKIPSPKGNEVLVEVKACGICMTDYHIYKGNFKLDRPVVLGHEFSGIVEAVGNKVKNFKIGDRVTVNPTISCGKCVYCVRGDSNLCENGMSLGGAAKTILDGGFQEYTLVPEENLGILKNEISFEEGAFVEPLGCAIRGIQQSRLKIGEKVLIVGAGPMGLLLLQLSKINGASMVIVSELNPERREMAKKLGADYVLDPTNSNIPETVKEISNGGVDLAIEAVGKEITFKDAYESVGKKGRVLVFGVPSETASFSIPLFDIYFREIEVIGSFAISKESFNIALELLNNEKIRVKELISHRLTLEELPKALEMQEKSQGLKKMIIF